MGLLRFPGMFTMPVADGWELTAEEDEPVVLTSPDNTVVHLSTYDRNAGAFEQDEAREVMETLLNRASPTGDVVIEVLRARTEHRANARFAGIGPLGEPLHWCVTVVLRRKHMLLCSCFGDAGSPAIDEAERMFASITPDKKGWFRR